MGTRCVLDRHFVRLSDDGSVIWRGEVPDEWAQATARAARNSAARSISLPGPDGAECFVKIPRRRPGHGVFRRLRASRALLEGRGYVAFQQAGIPTAELLAFGERRRFGLFDLGFVATRRVDAPNIETVLRDDLASDVLLRTTGVLADIHARGLTHGDPLLRNFLATEPLPTPIDLGGFARCDEEARRVDLVRFLGSLLMLTDDPTPAVRAIDHYASYGALNLAREPLLEAADAYARRKEDKERQRERRRAAAPT